MILSRPSVLRLIDLKQLRVEPFMPANLDEHGVLDLTLSTECLEPERARREADSRRPHEFGMLTFWFRRDRGYLLRPGKFMLFRTNERLELGHRVFCLLSTRPAMAKLGLDFIQSSAFVPPLSRGRLTLETSNRGPNPIRLWPGVAVVKAVFMRMD